jgi:2-oxoglutarate dehydrogenase E2 component (dihydrolipoamide succinyltransferase)
MAVELKVPSAGESITEVTIVEWLKKEGSFAKPDEIVAVIETDKANVDVVAPVGGKITRILKGAGDVAQVGEVIGHMEVSDGSAPDLQGPAKTTASPTTPVQKSIPTEPGSKNGAQSTAPSVAPSAEPAVSVPAVRVSPSLRRVMRSQNLRPEDVAPRPGRAGEVAHADPDVDHGLRTEEVVPMTPIRRRIAERLVEAQQTAALLTTFNEVDMGPVMAVRAEFKDRFEAKYGIKLGFMSFFVKAAVEALKAYPAVNSEIRGTDIIYRNYFDIGVAVGGGRGLVVPVIRGAERLGFADIERTIADFGQRAKSNQLKVEELKGGTFTISNGGIYGSMMSTPIVNPPQSGILGMHAIQDRPVVKNGQVVPAKMMYLALTYDHRVVDGREAVSFLVRVKECVESPARVLLEV